MRNSIPRILHISSPLSWRGGEQQIAYLQEELAKQEVFQIIICPIGSVMESYCKENNIHYVSVKKRSSIDLGFAKALKKICVSEKINLMHAHDSHAHTFSVLSKVFYNNPANTILSRRVDFPVKKSWFSHFKYNHASVKKIICVSQAIKQIMLPAIADKTKLTVVHSGIDFNKFSAEKTNRLRTEFNLDPSLPLIANVGALAQQKDYFTFIDTMVLLLKNNVKANFLGIGEGAQRAEILAYAKEKKVSEYLTLTGFRTDVAQIFSELDILLFSSETEGLGTTILDAFATKVPVVATNAGGIPELVKHLKTGYLGAVKNPESLADGVQLFLNEPKIKSHVVKNAAQFVQGFNKAETATKTLAIYKAVLA